MSKFRKVLSVLTSAAITASMLSALTVTASASESELFSYDFESGEAWIIDGKSKGNYTNAFAYNDAKASNVYNLALSGSNTGGREANVTIPQTAEADNVKVSFDVYINTTIASCSTDLIVMDSSANAIFKVSDSNSNTIYLNGDSTVLSNANWYKVEAVLNFETKQVVYANLLQGDTVVATQKHAPFMNSAAANVGRIGMQSNRASGSSMSGGAMIDNLAAYSVTDEIYVATLAVKDSAENSVANAKVTFDDKEFTTDSEGIVKVAVLPGEYSYTVTKDGYEATQGVGDDASGSVTVSDSDVTEDITYSPKSYVAVPDVVTMSGGQAAMTAPIVNESYSGTAFTVAVADQENVPIVDADIEWTIEPSDDHVSVADGVVTVTKGFDGGESHVKTFTVTATATKNNSSQSASSEVSVSDYRFYEPGVGSSSYGEAEVHGVGGINYITTGSTKNAEAVISIPEPVAFTAGTAQLLSFDTTMTSKEVYTFQRSVIPMSSTDEDIVSLDYVNLEIGSNTTWSTSNSTLGVVYGAVPAIDSWVHVDILFKTNANNVTTATLTIGGQENDLGVISATDLAKIKLKVGNCGSGTDRYIALKDIVVKDVDVAGLDLFGASKFSTVTGVDAVKEYEVSAMVIQDGETFTWSTTIPGATIVPSEDTMKATLTVPGSTVSGGTITVTSSESTPEKPKSATLDVTIEAADIQSAALNGLDTLQYTVGAEYGYSVSDVIDQFDADITKLSNVTFESSNTGVLTIDSEGVAKVAAPGDATIKATVTAGTDSYEVTKNVKVVSLYLEGTTSEVNAANIISSENITGYRVTTAKDGVIVSQYDTETVPASVDLTDADSYEIDPIYTYNSLSGVAGAGFTVADSFAEGFYNMTFTKGDTKRADIYVNDYMVGNNVDQYGEGRAIADGTEYTINDAVVKGGSIKISTTDLGGNGSISKAVIVKAPSNVTRKAKLYVTGDSLVANYYGSYAEGTEVGGARTGWGQVLDNYINADMEVVNLANSGQYAEGLLTSAFPGIIAMAQPGDYFVLESGYNDRTYSTTEKMYNAVVEMVEQAEAKGMNVVLVSPNASQHDYKSSVQYASTMTQAAKDMMAKYDNVIYVDLSKLSYEFMVSTGIDTVISESAQVIKAAKNDDGTLASVSIIDSAALKVREWTGSDHNFTITDDVDRIYAPTANAAGTIKYSWNTVSGLKPVTTSSNTQQVALTYNLVAVQGDRLHSSYAAAMKWAEIVAQGMKDGGAGFINTDFSYTFTDTIGNKITCNVK